MMWMYGEHEKAVQGIISDAIAIATAKKEQEQQVRNSGVVASELDLQILQTIQALHEVVDLATPGDDDDEASSP